MQVRCSSSGIGLLETMTVLAVLSITVALAVPSANRWLQDARQVQLANDFLSDLQLARTEAIRRGQRVVLCPSADGSACATRNDWLQGRIVFVDANNNASREAAEPLLAVGGAGPVGWLFQGNAPMSRYVSYHPTGRTRLISGAQQMGTVTICRPASAPVSKTQIVISASGRPRSERVSAPSCAAS